MQSKLYSYMHSKTVQVPVELPGIEAATDTTTPKDTWMETNEGRQIKRETQKAGHHSEGHMKGDINEGRQIKREAQRGGHGQ